MAKASKRAAFVNNAAPAYNPVFALPQWLSEFKVQAVIVAGLAIGLYLNTFKNGYTLDDTVVIVQNEFVLEGFAGIPGIMTKDAYYSYYRQLNTSNQLSGGRYRPLSIVTFAIEQHFFGAIPKDDGGTAYLSCFRWVCNCGGLADVAGRLRPRAAKYFMAGVMSVLVILCGYRTIARNEDWKSDKTRFFHDINESPNSFLVNANVAVMLINESDFVKDQETRKANLHRGVAIFTKLIAMQVIMCWPT